MIAIVIVARFIWMRVVRARRRISLEIWEAGGGVFSFNLAARRGALASTFRGARNGYTVARAPDEAVRLVVPPR